LPHIAGQLSGGLLANIALSEVTLDLDDCISSLYVNTPFLTRWRLEIDSLDALSDRLRGAASSSVRMSDCTVASERPGLRVAKRTISSWRSIAPVMEKHHRAGAAGNKRERPIAIP
jgi:hypothetical protein